MSFLSFISAFIITLEKIELLKNPAHVTSCNISPFISCGPIMSSWQASLFVIPNPILGLLGFTLLIFIMVLSLSTRLPNWVWMSTFVGVTLAFAFIIWLVSQALFVIGTLCVYCMFVWAMMIPIFWLTFSITIKKFGWSKLMFVVHYKAVFIFVSYAALFALVFLRFLDSWLLMF